MRITLIAYGTRGDVQPICGIGLALAARGHSVRVAAPRNHVSFVERCALEAAPLAGDSDEILLSPEGQRWLATGNSLKLMHMLGVFMEQLAPEIERDLEAVTADAEGIVAGVLTMNTVRAIAEARGVPAVPVHTFPMIPSRAFPCGIVGARRFPRVLNKFSAELTYAAGWWAHRRLIQRHRQRLGLPPATRDACMQLHRERRTQVHAWSPTLVPRPPDWEESEVVSGFCTLPSTARAGLGESDALRELGSFLDAGPAPFYIGLGSMPVLDVDALLKSVVDAAHALGVRVILSAGSTWQAAASAARLPETVRFCGAVDHDALFPRCAGVLHHGGAGSTATSLRAGVPTFVCSVFADQNFWGRAVEALGVGVWRRFRDLDGRALQEGLRELMRDEVRERARAVGVAMRQEQGSATAAVAIERALMREGPPPSTWR